MSGVTFAVLGASGRKCSGRRQCKIIGLSQACGVRLGLLEPARAAWHSYSFSVLSLCPHQWINRLEGFLVSPRYRPNQWQQLPRRDAKLPFMTLPVSESNDYGQLLGALKERIRSARLRTAVAVNRALVELYWSIGRDILVRQNEQGWGAKIVARLAGDLRRDFPEMTGLSPRNLNYMRAFAEAFPDEKVVQQLVAQLPWGHVIKLIETVKSLEQRLWYARQTVENGWSRNVLIHQIESDLFARQGKALTNFARTLPAPQSDLAQEIMKDPYTFDFLALGPDISERELEKGLLEHLRQLILELGKGFAFVGSQYHLEVGGQDYYLDLLFYHLHLRCFVVVELKIEEFKPEFAGKMNFYLSAVDSQLRHADDAPTIGIILCKGRNEVIVEYALRDSTKPMGVAEYRLSEALPERFKAQLPTAAEFAREFPLMSLVKLRIEIEREMRRLLTDVIDYKPLSISAGLTGIIHRGYHLPHMQEMREVIHFLNLASHGHDISNDDAKHATEIATRFLSELKNLESI